jgi:PAS domain S-box-containing protein
MPWTEQLANFEDLRRRIRDLAAFSTFPAAWRNYDIRQIGDSIVAALIPMLVADFVLIELPSHDDRVTELIRSDPKLDPGSLDDVRAMLQREKAAHGAEREFVVGDTSGGKTLHVATLPIGLGGDAALTAGSSRSTFPTKTEKLLLVTAANQAAIAIQQWSGDVNMRRFTTLVERSTDFVGIASLRGQVEYVNPAGLELVGLGALDDALRLHMLDFFSPPDWQTVQNEIWPVVLRGGRWKGELDLVHFRSGMPMPFLVDCFKIDDPRTGQAMNIATVSRDLSELRIAEAELRHLNESIERRVEQRTIELGDANRRLLDQNFQREQTDLRFQKLRNQLFHSARLSAAGHMAGVLAHELNQPLTAVINSVNAVKRLLTCGNDASLVTALDVADEAAAQALRAGEIIRGLRQLASLDKTERRVEALPSMIEEAGALGLSSVAPLTAQLSLDFDGEATGVLVNRVQIQQVLVNLIRNATEAMADQDRREITLATKVLCDGMIEIAVIDIGPGIHGDMAGRLFEPFVSSKHEGMGLGLPTSRSIIEAHGGQLTVGPKPGGGTIFRFTVPSAGGVDASSSSRLRPG